jgi:hypothetical protein
MKTCPKKKKKK